MTVREAIARCDAVKPNQYTEQEKIRWLSDLDGRISEEILKRHERQDGDAWDFERYGEKDIDATLLAARPYDALYPLYLQSQVDFFNAEYDRYNNGAALFNEAYSAYADWINRTRKPVGVREINGLM